MVSLQNHNGLAHEEAKDQHPITVVLAIYRSDLRGKLRLLLETDPHLQVVGEVNNGLDALDIVGNLHPDILLFNLNSSDKLEIIRLVNQRAPRTAVIVPHEIGNDQRARDLLQSGVKTYVLKNLDETQLLEAIRYVNATKNGLSTAAMKPPQSHDPRRVEYVRDPIDVLTAREREVFELIVRSMTNAQIAKQLSISRRTVEMHRARILRKLGLLNQRQQLIAYAASRGIQLNGSK